MWLLLWLKTIVFLAIKVVQESPWEDGMITETVFSLFICYCKDRTYRKEAPAGKCSIANPVNH